MQRHFVTFYCPGTFMAEQRERPIDSWDVARAQEMAAEIKVRYDATPYGFRFSTRSRGPEDLDSKVSDTSPMYYLPHCKVETLEEVQKRNDPNDKILLSNMQRNGYDRVVTTTKGWGWTQPLGPDDAVLPA